MTPPPLFLTRDGRPSTDPDIRSDRPMPEGHRWPESMQSVMGAALLKLKAGGSLDTSMSIQSIHRTAKRFGVKIVTRKLNGSGYTVWRKE